MGSAFDGERVYFLTPQNLGGFFQENPDTIFTAHNASFELSVLANHLRQPKLPFALLDSHRVIDTIIVARLIELARSGDPTNKKGKYSLGCLVQSNLKATLPKEVIINGRVVRRSYGDFQSAFDAMPDGYFHYNAFDSISTRFLLGILRIQADEISATHGVNKDLLLSHFGQIKTAYSAQLTERKCFAVDQIAVRENVAKLKLKVAENDAELKLAGYFAGTGRDKRFAAMSMKIESEHGCSLPKFTDKRGREKYSMKAEDLAPFEKIGLISAYLKREYYAKRLSTFAEPFVDMKVCQPSINLLMETGRVSVSSPALQTIPKPDLEFDFRRQFVGHNNHPLIITDIVGAELVTLAQHCRDSFGFSDLGEALNQGEDVHRLTASKFFGCSPKSLDKEQRNYGKIPNFGLPGGAGSETLMRTAKASYGTEISEGQAKALIQAWHSQYREMRFHLESAVTAYEAALSLPSFPDWSSAPVSAKQSIFFGIIAGRTHTKTTDKPYTLNLKFSLA